ncbi:hypothetical protein [Alkalicoccus daliensis]|uniref:Uncharacterized protein n=1 Tax=Alkalicoccus daliensis TaxID=745820 RepID=A0A1H0E8K6_9BACI|nr:hypothetical protein [Alkalicoccus daliensis]SDN78722.1 hypothetical protein SAMN04488053_103246 [Alkalicoccus daliensis]
MIRESKIFESERSEYQNIVDYGGIYPMGTFMPQDNQNLQQTFVQMVPTQNTVLMYNTLRNNLGYEAFEDSYNEDPTIYTLSGGCASSIVKSFYDRNARITNMTGEFLDSAGIFMANQTIQLVELTEDNGLHYYVITGGKGAIEAKADELYNANLMLTEALPFQLENEGISINSMAIVELALAMANDVFDRKWTVNDPMHAQDLYAVESDQMIDMEESAKWIPLQDFENWTNAKRLGIVFRIQTY